MFILKVGLALLLSTGAAHAASDLSMDDRKELALELCKDRWGPQPNMVSYCHFQQVNALEALERDYDSFSEQELSALRVCLSHTRIGANNYDWEHVQSCIEAVVKETQGP